MFKFGLIFHIIFFFIFLEGLVNLNNSFLLAMLLFLFFFILYFLFGEYIKKVLNAKIMKVYKRYIYLLNLLRVKLKFVRNILDNELRKSLFLQKILSIAYLKRKYLYSSLEEVLFDGLKKWRK